MKLGALWIGTPCGGTIQLMTAAKLAAIGLSAVSALAIALAGPAHADVDTDFANQLHDYGIYGPRDYNAWLGKIACNRLGRGLDPSAYQSAQFIFNNLPQHTTTAQSWQFLGAAISTYCPDLQPRLAQAAAQPG